MNYCENCGAAMSEHALACPNCGHPRAGAPVYTGQRRTEGLAVASLVLGIAGFVVFPLITSILAVVFGKQAQSKIAADPSLDGAGMAKAGVVLGWIGIALGAVIFFAFCSAVTSIRA